MYNGFHSFPDTLRGDDYSGDYGPTFLGMMLGSGTYVLHDDDFGMGLVVYGGNGDFNSTGNEVRVQPRDAVRRRVYIAQIGVYITISVGWIEEFVFDTYRQDVRLKLGPGPAMASEAVVWVEMSGTSREFAVTSGSKRMERGGWVVDLGGGADVIISKV